MCGRFSLTTSAEQISAILPELVFETELEPRYNIAPTQEIAAVRNDGRWALSTLRWGLIPFWAKDASIGNRMINARAESLADKPSFKAPLKRQRCLILADGFYEWKAIPGQKVKQPHYIRMKSGAAFGLAGLWDSWRDPEGNEVLSATIITTSPNALVAELHDRMPVILRSDNYERWLDPAEREPGEMLECLGPYAAEEMEAYAVSTRVNRPGVDEPACIDSVEV